MTNNFVQNLINSPFVDTYKPLHQEGPDYVYPTNELRAWLADGKVRLNTNKEPKTVVTHFRQTVEKYKNKVALVTKRNGVIIKWSYPQFLADVTIVAKAFIKLGLGALNGVCILGFNAPEWHISHLATIFAGGIAAGIYTSNSPAACFHVINDCDANIVVVENEVQLNKILSIRNQLPKLKAIIQYRGEPSSPDVISWQDLFKIGDSLPDEILDRRIKGLSVNQCCFLIYTSGTTGNPKGVMASHDSVLAFSGTFRQYFLEPLNEEDRVISFLPMSHMAALATDLYLALEMGATVYFVAPDILKDKLLVYLQEVRPTILGSVPRILEKIKEKLQDVEVQMTPIMKAIFQWAQKQGVDYHLKRSANPMMYNLAQKLVINKIKAKFGLENVTNIMTGGAPVAVELKKFYLGLDIVLLDMYGLSESTGVHIGNSMENFQLTGVGNVNYIKEFNVKIANPDEDGNGEILLYGRNVCMGYLKLENDTKEIITDDKWLHTGDIGKIDENGSLHVTGRVKEIIITSGGENIPPVLIENMVKNNVPIISNCILIGDQKKYLTMLIALKTEMDPNTALPIDALTPQAIDWCQSVGSEAKTISEILNTKDEKVMAAIQAGISKYNTENAISQAQKIQKWTIIPQDFCIANGDLGPTAKIRRPFIIKKYREEIDNLYNN